MKSMTLQKALKLWQMKTPLEDAHLEDSVLEALMEGEGDPDVFTHLSLCNVCRRELWTLLESRASDNQVDDYVLPLAASVGIPQEASWITVDEKFKIEFRRMVSDEAQRAVLIVRVEPPYDFTGRKITVRDASDRILLSGLVDREGKIAAIIYDVENLVLKELSITES